MNSVESVDLRMRLHDGLCQQLTAALMFSDALRRSLADRDAPELADCEQLVRILRESADELVVVMDLAGKKRASGA